MCLSKNRRPSIPGFHEEEKASKAAGKHGRTKREVNKGRSERSRKKSVAEAWDLRTDQPSTFKNRRQVSETPRVAHSRKKKKKEGK